MEETKRRMSSGSDIRTEFIMAFQKRKIKSVLCVATNTYKVVEKTRQIDIDQLLIMYLRTIRDSHSPIVKDRATSKSTSGRTAIVHRNMPKARTAAPDRSGMRGRGLLR